MNALDIWKLIGILGIFFTVFLFLTTWNRQALCGKLLKMVETANDLLKYYKNENKRIAHELEGTQELLDYANSIMEEIKLKNIKLYDQYNELLKRN